MEISPTFSIGWKIDRDVETGVFEKNCAVLSSITSTNVTEVPCWMTLTFVELMELNGFVYKLVWSVGMRCCMVLYIVCGFTTLFSEGLCMWMSIDGHVLVVWRFVFVMFGQIGI